MNSFAGVEQFTLVALHPKWELCKCTAAAWCGKLKKRQRDTRTSRCTAWRGDGHAFINRSVNVYMRMYICSGMWQPLKLQRKVMLRLQSIQLRSKRNRVRGTKWSGNHWNSVILIVPHKFEGNAPQKQTNLTMYVCMYVKFIVKEKEKKKQRSK